jgi:uncharacterized protein YhbP (UPF0306 family)
MSSPSLDADDVSRLMSLLDEHWVLTLATREPTEPSAPPHCAPLFYALQRSDGHHAILVFTSDPNSAHGRHLGAGPTTAGAAIYLESETVGQLRGVQMRGLVERLDEGDPRLEAARARYLDRHPVAEPMLKAGSKHRLYRFELTWAKLTDNRLGFGVHPIVDFGAASET